MYKILANQAFRSNLIIHLPSCHSTNDYAANLIRNQTLLEGSVIITNEQTSGKGQRGNSWESAPFHNLTFSLILTPKFLTISNQFLITVVVSLGIIDALSEHLPLQPMIKWPNDIYVNDNKIAGVLIENVLKGSVYEAAIVGVGLNVNQNDFDTNGAVSVRNITDSEMDLNEVFNNVIKSIGNYYQILMDGKHSLLMTQYHEHLYWLNKQHYFSDTSGRKFKGEILGVDQYGRLEISDGVNTKFYMNKEVVFEN